MSPSSDDDEIARQLAERARAIIVPFYTTRDLSPAEIEKLDIHLVADPNGKSACGYGLPGRYSAALRWVTCAECRAFERGRASQIGEIARLRAVIEHAAEMAASQAPAVPDDTPDEYRRGQKRGALDAAYMVRRALKRAIAGESALVCVPGVVITGERLLIVPEMVCGLSDRSPFPPGFVPSQTFGPPPREAIPEETTPDSACVSENSALVGEMMCAALSLPRCTGCGNPVRVGLEKCEFDEASGAVKCDECGSK